MAGEFGAGAGARPVGLDAGDRAPENARDAGDSAVLADFVGRIPVRPDDFQLEACEGPADADEGVLVAAPTGAGKTVVAEHAVARAVASGGKCFYTTPIKALSNQKYGDLRREVRRRMSIGLLTGDTAGNGEAPVVVMTTGACCATCSTAARRRRAGSAIVVDG